MKNKAVLGLFLAILTGVTAVFAEEVTTTTALYRVDKIQQISKKRDIKCVDTAAKACELFLFWKVRYQALDALVPVQEHEVSFDENLPQVGSITQLTIGIPSKANESRLR